jgi:hypothetical protein
MDTIAVDAAMLPPFSNMRARCSACGARYEIRVHFDRDCALVKGEHFQPRVPVVGNQWIERCSQTPSSP